MIDGEKNIIERAIGGEASAFGRLYDEYQPKIYRFIYLKVGHREEAEDLCHQTFISAWENIGNYRFQGYLFSTWLYSIARNKVIDYYRARKQEVDINLLENVLQYEDNIVDRTNFSFQQKAFFEELKKLTDEQQLVIKLKFLDDLDNSEIAQILNKSEGAIRVIQHRAINELKHLLNENENNHE